MRKPAALATIGTLAVLGHALQAPASAAEPEVAAPVMVGGASDEDACGATGEVAVSGSLNVRSAPALGAPVIDRLRAKAKVIRCDPRGDWIGIVYPAELDCGTGSPIAQREPYAGRCRSGWVHARYVVPYAG